MDVVNLKINEEDIKKYLKRNKEKFNGKEALFLEYLKENKDILTKEMIEILLEKNYYQLIKLKKEDINVSLTDVLPSFEPYTIQKEKELNSSRICHILIPTFKYYGSDVININKLYTALNIVADSLVIRNDKPMEIVEKTIDDYRIIDKIIKHDNLIIIKMSKEKCSKELKEYSNYYDSDDVKKIRKIIRNGDF